MLEARDALSDFDAEDRAARALCARIEAALDVLSVSWAVASFLPASPGEPAEVVVRDPELGTVARLVPGREADGERLWRLRVRSEPSGSASYGDQPAAAAAQSAISALIARRVELALGSRRPKTLLPL